MSSELFHRFGLSFYIEDAYTKTAEHFRFLDILIHNKPYFMYRQSYSCACDKGMWESGDIVHLFIT